MQTLWKAPQPGHIAHASAKTAIANKFQFGLCVCVCLRARANQPATTSVGSAGRLANFYHCDISLSYDDCEKCTIRVNSVARLTHSIRIREFC